MRYVAGATRRRWSATVLAAMTVLIASGLAAPMAMRLSARRVTPWRGWPSGLFLVRPADRVHGAGNDLGGEIGRHNGDADYIYALALLG